jgi:predicted acylesterase/phospholipase RssA
MTIVKHLVFSGGGPIGFVEYGALKYLTEKNFLDYKNIESIYSISVGGIIGLIYILNYDWTWMDDFLIKRPWNKLCNISYSSYINILYEKGIINKKVIISALEPLFLAKNIPLNITLLEFYNLTKIEFNIFACCLSNLKQTKFNYITTPNVELIDALYISLAVPIVFAPLYVNEDLYLDGGIIVGCPINLCIADKECNNDEIFCFMNDKMHPIDLSNSFYNKYSENTKANNVISKEANFFEYIFFLIKKLFVKISNVENDIVTYIKNHINTALSYNSIDISYWFQVMSCEKERCHLVNLGKIQATNFLNKLEEDALKETRRDEQIATLVNHEGEAEAHAEAQAEAQTTITISISISNQEKEEGTGEAEPNTSSLTNQEEERETDSKSSF